MRKEYIPILVQSKGKKELWRIDVTNLSVTELIQLRDIILSYAPYDKTIESLDSVIKRDIETTIPSHNMSKGSYIREYKKNKKGQKHLKRVKSRRKKHDKYKR